MTKPEENKFVIACIIILCAGPFFFCGCNPDSAKQPIANATANEAATGDIETQATKIIQQALVSDNPQVRANAIEVAAATGKQFMPDIQRLLQDKFIPVRFSAAVAIGDARYRGAKNDIAQLLKDDDENVRIAADYAISRITPGVPTKQLLAAITSSNQQVRANAAMLLGKTGDKSVLPLLYETIRDEASDDRVRLNSVEAIARLGDERIYQKLWAMLISAYADDRVCGIRAMGALGNSKARDSLLTMLKDDLAEVRLVAAEQLGGLGDTTGEKIVLDAMGQVASGAIDQEGRERIETLAALAIGQIRTPALKKFLPELLKNESRFVQLVAAKAVLKYAAPR
ncbi:MAG: HEAT repeat domain-containing protein [Sedimentisphaerales bacterium]|jgi:HEAT repeat protein